MGNCQSNNGTQELGSKKLRKKKNQQHDQFSSGKINVDTDVIATSNRGLLVETPIGSATENSNSGFNNGLGTVDPQINHMAQMLDHMHNTNNEGKNPSVTPNISNGLSTEDDNNNHYDSQNYDDTIMNDESWSYSEVAFSVTSFPNQSNHNHEPDYQDPAIKDLVPFVPKVKNPSNFMKRSLSGSWSGYAGASGISGDDGTTSSNIQSDVSGGSFFAANSHFDITNHTDRNNTSQLESTFDGGSNIAGNLHNHTVIVWDDNMVDDIYDPFSISNSDGTTPTGIRKTSFHSNNNTPSGRQSYHNNFEDQNLLAPVNEKGPTVFPEFGGTLKQPSPSRSTTRQSSKKVQQKQNSDSIPSDVISMSESSSSSSSSSSSATSEYMSSIDDDSTEMSMISDKNAIEKVLQVSTLNQNSEIQEHQDDMQDSVQSSADSALVLLNAMPRPSSSSVNAEKVDHCAQDTPEKMKKLGVVDNKRSGNINKNNLLIVTPGNEMEQRLMNEAQPQYSPDAIMGTKAVTENINPKRDMKIVAPPPPPPPPRRRPQRDLSRHLQAGKTTTVEYSSVNHNGNHKTNDDFINGTRVPETANGRAITPPPGIMMPEIKSRDNSDYKKPLLLMSEQELYLSPPSSPENNEDDEDDDKENPLFPSSVMINNIHFKTDISVTSSDAGSSMLEVIENNNSSDREVKLRRFRNNYKQPSIEENSSEGQGIHKPSDLSEVAKKPQSQAPPTRKHARVDEIKLSESVDDSISRTSEEEKKSSYVSFETFKTNSAYTSMIDETELNNGVPKRHSLATKSPSPSKGTNALSHESSPNMASSSSEENNTNNEEHFCNTEDTKKSTEKHNFIPIPNTVAPLTVDVPTDTTTTTPIRKSLTGYQKRSPSPSLLHRRSRALAKEAMDKYEKQTCSDFKGNTSDTSNHDKNLDDQVKTNSGPSVRRLIEPVNGRRGRSPSPLLRRLPSASTQSQISKSSAKDVTENKTKNSDNDDTSVNTCMKSTTDQHVDHNESSNSSPVVRRTLEVGNGRRGRSPSPLLNRSRVTTDSTTKDNSSPVVRRTLEVGNGRRGRSPSPLLNRSRVSTDSTTKDNASPVVRRTIDVGNGRRGRSPSPLLNRSRVSTDSTTKDNSSPVVRRTIEVGNGRCGRSPSPLLNRSRVTADSTTTKDDQRPSLTGYSRRAASPLLQNRLRSGSMSEGKDTSTTNQDKSGDSLSSHRRRAASPLLRRPSRTMSPARNQIRNNNVDVDDAKKSSVDVKHSSSREQQGSIHSTTVMIPSTSDKTIDVKPEALTGYRRGTPSTLIHHKASTHQTKGEKELGTQLQNSESLTGYRRRSPSPSLHRLRRNNMNSNNQNKEGSTIEITGGGPQKMAPKTTETEQQIQTTTTNTTESSANNNNNNNSIIAQDSPPRKVEYTKGYRSSRRSYSSSTSSRKSTSSSGDDQDSITSDTISLQSSTSSSSVANKAEVMIQRLKTHRKMFENKNHHMMVPVTEGEDRNDDNNNNSNSSFVQEDRNDIPSEEETKNTTDKAEEMIARMKALSSQEKRVRDPPPLSTRMSRFRTAESDTKNNTSSSSIEVDNNTKTTTSVVGTENNNVRSSRRSRRNIITSS